jgi:hypothetical protein
MLAELADFRWHVFSRGYKCVDRTLAKGQPARLLVPRWWDDDADGGGSDGENPIDPMAGDLNERHPLEEEPGLHRKFASLELTEQAIVDFANQWGPLENAHEVAPDEIEDTMVAYVGDTTEEWFAQIRRMKALVDLRDVLEGKSEKKLADVIDIERTEYNWSWDVDIRFKDCPQLRWNFTFRERDWPGFSEVLESGGTRDVARTCLFDLANESLWGSCSPWLSINEDNERPVLCLTPHNLMAALWLMFAQEILGEKNLKQCLYCKRYFEATKETNDRRQRSDKKYCSPKCRGAAFRERAEKASTEKKDA